MSNFYNLSDMAKEITLPINQFSLSTIFYSISIVEDGKLFQAILLKKKEKDVFLLVGFNATTKEICSINKTQALQALKLISRRANSEYNLEKFSFKDIEKAINEFEKSIFAIEKKKESFFYTINKRFNILLSNKSQLVPVELTVISKGDYSLVPISLYYVSHDQIIDYGELSFSDLENIENAKFINLLDYIVIDLKIGQNSFQYGGENYEIRNVDEEITLIFSSPFYSLNNFMMGKVKAENISLSNMITPILGASGLQRENINIEGYSESFLPHVLLFPLKNFIVTEKFGLGSVSFFSSEDAFPEIEEVKRISGEDFDSFKTEAYATVPLMASNFQEAFIKALAMINIALDSISHISKQDNLINDINVTKNNIWKRGNIFSKPYVSTYYYVENLITNEKMIHEVDSFYQPVEFTVTKDFLQKLSDFEWYEELISLHMDNQDEKWSSLFVALKWLKRSWNSDNIEDQIIYTIISLEFILGTESLKSNIEKADRREVANQGGEAFKKRHINVSDEELTKLKEKIMNSLASVPLLAKLRNMISRLKIPIDDKDFKKIHAIREARNKLVHGKSIDDVEQIDIWKVNNLIGKIIFYKLKYHD
ncbi:hypothetical protein BBI11_03795 [Planococcus maritimus]|uniref:HEPN domain-containing protein n=1 Tax=Planococcus maritimus TaxID=192421 RepID=UPI00080EF0DB|nr:HEPN domain-containing protein [Planococcus maritimus]ANU16228.1 hypothetical protein BBI11_03795 [Planococcus maritimus]